MSNRAIYAILALVAVAAVAGLYFLVQGDSAEDAPASARAGSGAVTTNSGFTGPGHGPAGGPSLPAAAGSDLPERVKEYAANGAIIRDHRTGTHAPIDLDPNARPPNARKIDPTLTKAVADRVRVAMHDCVVAMPESARGEKPRLEGSINIAIKDKQISIVKTAINLRDVVGDAAEATRQCIEQKAMAITQPAGDEQDLPSYDINLSFALI